VWVKTSVGVSVGEGVVCDTCREEGAWGSVSHLEKEREQKWVWVWIWARVWV